MQRMPQDARPPRGVTGWLIRRAVPRGAESGSPDTRIRLGMLEGWTSTGISVVLSSAKLLLGWMTGSIAVLADGINNLADVGSSLVIALSFRWSRKPRDAEHPFGHGRIETVAALVLAVFLLAVGFDVAKESIHRLLNPRAVSASWQVLVVIGATLVVKQWLALFARRLARITGAPVLEADFWNHQFDVISTSAVVVALVMAHFGWSTVDGWAGLLVSGVILFTGYRYARSAVSALLGEAPTPQELEAIRRTALGRAGVHGVHDIVMHKYGDVRVASLHIEVDAGRTALDVHDLAEQVERAVEAAADCSAIVHVDPVDRDHPMYRAALECLEKLAIEDGRVSAFHDLRITGNEGGYEMTVDVVAGDGVREEEYASVSRELADQLRGRLRGLARVGVAMESRFPAPHGR